MTADRRADRPKGHVPEQKSFPVAHFKALKSSDAPGTFEAIVAVFDNIDSYGDRIRSGAFTRTLDERGLPPIVWSHDWLTPPIGASLDAGERSASGDLPAGLWVKGRLLVYQTAGADHAVARQVWAAMTAAGGDGRPPLKEFSFGFRTRKAQWVEEDPDTLPADAQWTGGEIRDLLDLDLYEVGPTLVGANPATELIAAKAALLEARRHGLTSDDVRTLFGNDKKERDDDPAGGGRKADLPDEVRAGIAAVDDLRPPITL
jgi:HK97 family phage prohead protease